jgi:cholesterol oxidase
MRWLSKSVDDLATVKDGKVHDVIVVGSGYGGAVAALRLAEAGLEVSVLERGEEYQPGEFPNDIATAFSAVRIDRNGAKNISGYESALFDVHMGENITALVGNALGGTSQINANVAKRVDPRVLNRTDELHRPIWPAEIRNQSMAPNGSLDLAYKKAETALGVNPLEGLRTLNKSTFEVDLELHPCLSKPNLALTIPLRSRRMFELQQTLKTGVFVKEQLAVQLNGCNVSGKTPQSGLHEAYGDDQNWPKLDECIGCGDCVSGCNAKAKKTLTSNYLPAAVKNGAKIYTGVSVLRVVPVNGVWIVEYVPSYARKDLRDKVTVPIKTIRAKNVVLAAGTFGSTEIMLRSQSESMRVSLKLGQSLSSNGDNIAVGYQLKERVDGVGLGARRIPGRHYFVGPTITRGIEINSDTDVTESILIQDAAIPGALRGLYREIITTSATLNQLGECDFRGQTKAGEKLQVANDWLVNQDRSEFHSMALLAMGHDNSKGQINFDRELNRVDITYPADEVLRTADKQEKYLRAVAEPEMGGLFLVNPLVRPVPQNVTDSLSGPQIGGATITVHPLGGCPMADDIERGVVDDCGRVYQHGVSRFHDGLYILDGSIVPTSLGANPFLTITALAERAIKLTTQEIMDRCTERSKPAETQPLPASPSQPYRPPVQKKDTGIEFSEAMRGEMTLNKKAYKAHLFLHLPILDIRAFFSDPNHLITIPRSTLGSDQEGLQAQLSLQSTSTDLHDDSTVKRLSIVGGQVSILPVPRRGRISQISAFIRTLLTWFLSRGKDEIFNGGLSTGNQRLWDRILGFLKLARHTSEERRMVYCLELVGAGQNETHGNTGVISWILEGVKEVGYPASWAQIWKGILSWKAPARANLWMSLGSLAATIKDSGGKIIGEGRLDLDLLDMTRMHGPQFTVGSDTPNAIISLAGYPLWFLRLLLKTRLWDFRLPDYPSDIPLELLRLVDGKPQPKSIPIADVEVEDVWPAFPDLKVRSSEGLGFVLVTPEHFDLAVTKARDSSEKIQLKFTRYRQPKITSRPTRDGHILVDVMLMVNGFAQSTLPFVPREFERSLSQASDEVGLAAFFYEMGYDIWMFDYRTSPLLESSKELCTIDDIAEFDMPAAIAVIRENVWRELALPPDQLANLKLFSYAHCLGAGSLMMSLLKGYLGKRGESPFGGVCFGQMHPFLIGSATAQMRLSVAGLLRDGLGLKYLRMSAVEREANAFESVADRVFASFPVDSDQHCPGEFERSKPQPWICTCKRLTGWISMMLDHSQIEGYQAKSDEKDKPYLIKRATHDKMSVYFGRANTSVLVHGARCAANERLVNADGQNIYVTDANIQAYLDFPIAIHHGRKNTLFNVECAELTFKQICRVNPELLASGGYKKIIADSFAHFDCTVGVGPTMRKEILDPLGEFFKGAETWNTKVPEPVQPQATTLRSFARLPLHGPILGWSRLDQNSDGKETRKIRVWISVDENKSDRAAAVVSYLTTSIDDVAPVAQLWPVKRMPVANADLSPDDREPFSLEGLISIGIAEIEIPYQLLTTGEAYDLTLQMFSLHLLKQPIGEMTPAPAQAGELLARPLDVFEFALAEKEGWVPEMLAQELMDFITESASVIGDEVAPDPNQSAIIPSLKFSPDDADKLYSTMYDDFQTKIDRALSPEPKTLSRFKRLKPRDNMGVLASAKIWPGACLPKQSVPELRFFAGSCKHPGLLFEDTRSERSFERICLEARNGAPPSFMLHLGDQLYVDATAGVIETASPVEKVSKAYERSFSSSRFNELASSIPNYMVIDDHEIADNWSKDRLEIPKSALEKQLADALFATAVAHYRAFQWMHSPRNSKAIGFNYFFEECGYPFFVLDTRTSRIRYGPKPQVADPSQIEELLEWLKLQQRVSGNRPKFVTSGSVFAPGLVDNDLGSGRYERSADNWQLAQWQRDLVLSFIVNEGIRNVIFLAGDYHLNAIATISLPNGHTIHSIVVPPLYAPLPGANTSESQIARSESFELKGVDGSNNQVDISCELCSDNMAGFAEFHVLQVGDSKWHLDVDFHESVYRQFLPTEAKRHLRIVLI